MPRASARPARARRASARPRAALPRTAAPSPRASAAPAAPAHGLVPEVPRSGVLRRRVLGRPATRGGGGGGRRCLLSAICFRSTLPATCYFPPPAIPRAYPPDRFPRPVTLSFFFVLHHPALPVHL